MEKLEQILEFWNVDADMDQTEPGKELLKIPKLHNKYLTILVKHKMASKKSHFDYLRMRKLKWEYYTGKMSKEELEKHGWSPFQFTLKSDISTYLEADNDLIRLLEKKMYHEETVSVVEAIMKELNSRTYQLKDYISWERFIGGQ
jgi:hypothetical protein